MNKLAVGMIFLIAVILVTGVIVFDKSEKQVTGSATSCTNHAECSEVCNDISLGSEQCLYGRSGCCANKNIGQCVSGQCTCLRNAQSCQGCPTDCYAAGKDYCNGYTKTCEKWLCIDQDGQDYFTKGGVNMRGDGIAAGVDDVCGDWRTLFEFTCDRVGNYMRIIVGAEGHTKFFYAELIDCEYGCSDGRCLPALPADYIIYALDFPVEAWKSPSEAGKWGSCTSQQGTTAQLNSFCKDKKKIGLISENPCLQETASNRWTWNGNIPMVKGTSKGSGMALTKVKCSSTEYSTAGGIHHASERCIGKECTTEFLVDAWGYVGWGDCTSQSGTRTQYANYCKWLGFSGLAPGDSCFHNYSGPRWTWNGNIPMTKGTSTGPGNAVQKVKCI